MQMRFANGHFVKLLAVALGCALLTACRKEDMSDQPKYYKPYHETQMFADGTTAVAGTGQGWRSARSHISAADLIAGQSADLRRQPEGWSDPGFDTAGWDPVTVTDDGYANLVASPAPPVRAITT